jgi:hypothetical protein
MAPRPLRYFADLLTVPLHVTVPREEPKFQEPVQDVMHPLLKVKMLAT